MSSFTHNLFTSILLETTRFGSKEGFDVELKYVRKIWLYYCISLVNYHVDYYKRKVKVVEKENKQSYSEIFALWSHEFFRVFFRAEFCNVRSYADELFSFRTFLDTFSNLLNIWDALDKR